MNTPTTSTGHPDAHLGRVRTEAFRAAIREGYPMSDAQDYAWREVERVRKERAA